jgi:hypothetical protein
MFGRERRAAARAHQRERQAAAAEADRLLAEADRLDELTEGPNYQREITAERAARIRERIGEDLTADARAETSGPALTGGDLDAEVNRLADMYPEPEAAGGAPFGGGPLPDYVTELEPGAYLIEMPGGAPPPRPVPERAPQPDGGHPEAWDQYVSSNPGTEGHKAAYVDMHRTAGGQGFADPDPDRSYLIEHGYETDADRWAMPDGYRRAPSGGAEKDWPGPEPGPDAARWTPEPQEASAGTRDPAARAQEHLAREAGRHGEALRNSRVHAAAAALADDAAGREEAQMEVRRDQYEQSMADTWALGAATRLQEAGLEADDAHGRVSPEPLPRLLTPGESASPAPDPTHLPDGLPHPNQFLAEHGWATQGGWYVRQAEHQLEAG